MSTFIMVGVSIDWLFSLYLIPVAAIGHVLGIRVHQKITNNDQVFKQWVGGALFIISSFGLLKLFLS
jgi:uncharacterized membrane protein YfcA